MKKQVKKAKKKVEKINPGKGYRFLKGDEILQEGDEGRFVDSCGDWNKIQPQTIGLRADDFGYGEFRRKAEDVKKEKVGAGHGWRFWWKGEILHEDDEVSAVGLSIGNLGSCNHFRLKTEEPKPEMNEELLKCKKDFLKMALEAHCRCLVPNMASVVEVLIERGLVEKLSNDMLVMTKEAIKEAVKLLKD